MFRKRKNAPSEGLADTAPAAKKPCENGGGGSGGGGGGVTSVAGHENGLDEECVDDKEAARNTALIVRLPTQAPNAPSSNVIVIDDSDEETDTPTPGDVKPDRELLDQQLVQESSTSNVDTIDCKPPLTSVAADQPNRIENGHVASAHDSSQSPGQSCRMSELNVDGAGSGEAQACSSSGRDVDVIPPVMQPAYSDRSPSSSTSSASLSSQRKASKSAPGKRPLADRQPQRGFVMQDASIQTDSSISAEQQLESLRSNVLQLLMTIVPTLTCSNLEFVDEIVVEMVRVNAESTETDN